MVILNTQWLNKISPPLMIWCIRVWLSSQALQKQTRKRAWLMIKEMRSTTSSLSQKDYQVKGSKSLPRRDPPHAQIAGSPIRENVWKAMGYVFLCKQPGHFASKCLTRKDKGGARVTNSKGRVYSLDGKKDKANNDLIVCTCHLYQHEVIVFFYYGASNSFISFKCIERLNLEMLLLIPLMTVSTTTNGGIWPILYVITVQSLLLQGLTTLISFVCQSEGSMWYLVWIGSLPTMCTSGVQRRVYIFPLIIPMKE